MELNRVSNAPDRVDLATAIVSVADKRYLDVLVRGIREIAPECTIYSTGGTYKEIENITGGIDDRLKTMQSYTGQPEMQGGLVKTLDYRLYLGLLSEEGNPAHDADLLRLDARKVDLIVCNLYPFESVAARSSVSIEELRGNVDIGGPTMLRAAAKNFLRVASLCRPNDYGEFLDHLTQNNGATTLAYRAQLAARVFETTARYESAIAQALGGMLNSRTLTDEYHAGGVS